MRRSKAWAVASRVGVALEVVGLAAGAEAFVTEAAPGWLLGAAATVASGAVLALVAARQAGAALLAEEDAEDEAYLLAVARGEPAEHPDPERAAAYGRLGEALAKVPGPKPPAGWRERVMKKIDEEKGGEK